MLRERAGAGETPVADKPEASLLPRTFTLPPALEGKSVTSLEYMLRGKGGSRERWLAKTKGSK